MGSRLRPGPASCYTPHYGSRWPPESSSIDARRERSGLVAGDASPQCSLSLWIYRQRGCLAGAGRGCILFTDGRYRTQAKEEGSGRQNCDRAQVSCVAAAEWLAARRRSVPRRPRSASNRNRSPPACATGWPLVLKGKARLRSAPPAGRARPHGEGRGRDPAHPAGGGTRAPVCFGLHAKAIRPGVSEVEVAAAMEYEARCAGAEGMSFPTILASGTRSAIVHGRASSARSAARVRGLRFWCYTRRLLFGSHANRACRTAFRRGSTAV
jgi:hypothetical protein